MTQTTRSEFVIIGAGVAGALVARRLAESGRKVLILDAGGRISRPEAFKRYRQAWNRNLASPYRQWSWLSIPDEEKPERYYGPYAGHAFNPLFVKAVGGSTWHWTAITPRFLPADFKLKSRYGVGVDWPIDYEDLEPYYVQAEQALGVAGDDRDPHNPPRSAPYPLPPIPLAYSDQKIAEKLKDMGLKVSPFPAARNSRQYHGRPACRGNGTCTPLCPIGASYSADTDIEMAVRAGARLIERAVVHRLEHESGGRIIAAHYLHPDGSTHVARGRHFILACHAIETPRLLLLSRDERMPNGLANSSGMVGRNLMDHTIFLSTFRMPEPIYAGRGPQSIAAIHVGRDGAFRKDFAAAKFFIGNDINVHSRVARILDDPSKWAEVLHHLREDITHLGFIGAEIEQLPDPNNRIELDQTRRDPLGLPLPTAHFHSGPYTEKGLRHWQAYTEKMIRHMQARLEEMKTALSSHHPCGTTRMGDDPRHAVVDRHCQSHDHPNLHIVGTSVFPTMGTANPTLTLAALSLRLADRLKTR